MSTKLDEQHSAFLPSFNPKNQNTKDTAGGFSIDKNEENNLQSHLKASISVLKNMSDIRTDKVILGKTLIQDDKYPDDATLEKVANALLGEQEE